MSYILETSTPLKGVCLRCSETHILIWNEKTKSFDYCVDCHQWMMELNRAK